ncbi:hypothetical protein CPC08DRAFT_708421 [Agrocybe pediades]|nr:hypothetical protein CPC08DRAFT_708421 [Agrocybe pediades]
MRLFLLFYVVGMFLLSTGAMIQEIIAINADYLLEMGVAKPLGHDVTSLVLLPFTTPLIVWGADGLMMWRCIILYQGIPRAGEWALKVVLVILSLTTLGIGASSFVPAFNHPLLLSTPVVNIVLAAMLSGRILYMQRRLSKLLGSASGRPQSPYIKIAAMCIESSALIVVFSVASIIATLLAYSSWIGFLYLLLPHICVISPVLIIYRVAQGRSIEVMTSNLDGGRVSTMNFGGDTRTDC